MIWTVTDTRNLRLRGKRSEANQANEDYIRFIDFLSLY
jgi:hypothetical protein